MAKKPFSQEEIQDIKEYKQYLDDTITRYKSLQEELKKYNKYVASNAREAVKAQLRDITEQLGTYKEIVSESKKYENLVKKIAKQEEDIKKQTKERAEETEQITENLKEQNKELEQQAKRIKTLGEDWNEIDDLQTSISSTYGKQYGDLGAIQKKIDGTKAIVGSISKILQSDSKSYEDQLEKILEISQRYKEFPADFARMNKERARGKLTEKGMLDQLEDSLDEFDEMISKIQITNEETEKLVDLFKKLRDEQAAFNNAQKSKYEFKEGAGEFGNRYFGGAPIIGDALTSGGSIASKVFSGENIATATAVGAGYMALKAGAFLDAIKTVRTGERNIQQTFLGIGREYDTKIAEYQKDIESRTKEIELLGGYTKRFAEFDFDTEMLQLEKQFEKVSKTAFFGSGLGSPKYAKDQLELAGISADTIVSSMNDLSVGGNSALQSLGEDVAVFARKTGIATSEIASLTGMFRMLDKTKGSDALSALTGQLSKSKAEGFNPADIAGELANAGELALQYNIRSSEELIKQVKSVREMGASWSKISEAGKGMVLNYKDSIRKEMQLSALLGENVDLSEVRALFAAGRNAEAFATLKSSGLLEKAQNAGLFGTELLSGATNMPIQQMAAQRYEKNPTGGIVSNQQFLDAFKEAAKQQKIDAAEIDVDRAIIRMRASNLERGLIREVGTDETLANLDLAISDLTVRKFLETEYKTLQDGFYGLVTGLNPMEQLKMAGAPTLPTISPESKFKPGTPYSSKSEPKIIIANPTAMIKPLDESNQSLKKIDLASNSQIELLKNIQALTAATSGLANMNLSDIKLFMDGKEVKNRIEKIATQEKGKMRV